MNILQYIIDMGFSMDDTPLTNGTSSFVPNKDIGSYMDYSYVMKYNRLPSKAVMSYKLTDFPNILKLLKESDFKLMSAGCSFGRSDSIGYCFINDTNRMMIDIGSTRQRASMFDFDDPPDRIEVSNDVRKVDNVSVYFDLCKDYSLVNTLKNNFSHVQELDEKGKILLFEKTEFGEMVLTPYPIKGYDLDIKDNYNDDFEDVHNKLVKWIPDFKSQNNKLVLFNGQPGTGKTNYLKYLLNNTPDVKKIYIPPYFVQSISDPAFFPIIKREKDSLLIIEDAEKILVNREDQSDNSTISILLNLCDGIMADILNFKIIATFNTDESRIDDALKRKGRMFMKYKFDKLENSKASKLYEKVHGIPLDTDDDLTLAEIYNDENEFGKKKKQAKIGFGV